MKNIIYLLIITSLFSCQKDEENNDLSNSSTPKIVFGDAQESNMNGKVYTPTFKIASWTNGGHKFDSLDVNNDGIFDLAFVSYGSKWANTSSCEIYTLHDSAQILVDVVKDTVYKCFNNNNSEISSNKVSFNSKSGFKSYSQNDSITSVEDYFYPKMFNYGDELIKSDSNLTWRDRGLFTSYSEGYGYTSSDLYLRYRFGYWNNKGEQYLSFRLKNGAFTKYGWIKASIEYNIEMNISEFAISKD